MTLAVQISTMDAVDEVFRLYERHGSGDYLGENVSKTQHSVQCAILAEREGCSDEVRITLPSLGEIVWPRTDYVLGEGEIKHSIQSAMLAEREGCSDEVRISPPNLGAAFETV